MALLLKKGNKTHSHLRLCKAERIKNLWQGKDDWDQINVSRQETLKKVNSDAPPPFHSKKIFHLYHMDDIINIIMDHYFEGYN